MSYYSHNEDPLLDPPTPEELAEDRRGWHEPKRKFLTRRQATYALGLMDAAQRKEPRGVKVACRDKETGEIYEAQDGEVLHAQIALRVQRARNVEDGWTVPAGDDYVEAPARDFDSWVQRTGPNDPDEDS
jgi:hypothetical protein